MKPTFACGGLLGWREGSRCCCLFFEDDTALFGYEELDDFLSWLTGSSDKAFALGLRRRSRLAIIPQGR